MLRRSVSVTLATLLTACGSKAPPSPAPDTTPAPAASDVVASAPADAAPSPSPTDAAATPQADAPPTADAPPVPPTEDAAPAPSALDAIKEPLVIAPAGTSPSAVALGGKGARVALAVADASRPGHPAVRLLDLTSTPPGSASLLATVPEDLLAKGLGLELTQLRFDGAGETLVALGRVTEADKVGSRWHVHAWRFDLDEPEGKPPTPTWTTIFARTFESKQTPLLALREDGARLYLGGYGATAWDLPALPLEAPVPADPRPALMMPADSGWWLPTEAMEDEPLAFRIIETHAPEGPKGYGLVAGAFGVEGAKAEVDASRARPLPLFSNASVRFYDTGFAAEPLDAGRPPIAFTLYIDEIEPIAKRFAGDATVLAIGPDGSLLVADGSPRGLYAIQTYGPELRLPDALAASALGAIDVSLVLVVAPDGAVHLVPLPDAAPVVTWAEASDLSSLPPAFAPLFSKEGFALEGTSIQTSYDEDDSGKVTRSRIKGRCAADSVEVADGLYHAVVSCSDLNADYVVDFAGHWYATADRLWYRQEPDTDLVGLRRSPSDLGPKGGCLTQPSGEAHPELSERCLDGKGPSKARFEGGPSAYQVVVELRRAKP